MKQQRNAAKGVVGRPGWMMLGMLVASGASALAEEITLTTYYPSPRGVYEELRTTQNAYLATLGGNVGIGTTSPAHKLDVRASDAGGGLLTVQRLSRATSGTPSDGIGATLLFAADGLYSSYPMAQISGMLTSVNTGMGALVFSTIAGGNFSEKVRIDSNGNVGIGTASPEAKLHVVGDDPTHKWLLVVWGATAEKEVLGVFASASAFPNGSGGAIAGTQWLDGGALWATPMIYRSIRMPDAGGGTFPDNQYGELMLQGTSAGNDYNRGISFVTSPSDATGPQMRMRITKDGDIGIGTTSPATHLHLAKNQPTIRLDNTNAIRTWDVTSDNTFGGSFQIRDMSAAGGPAVRLHLDTEGDVGIGAISPSGTPAPGSDLDIRGRFDGGFIRLSYLDYQAPGEIGMTSHRMVSNDVSRVWIGSNLDSNEEGHVTLPRQATPLSPSWLSMWDAWADAYTVQRIPPGGG